MANEDEEFEFRLRAENEAQHAPAPLKAAGPTGAAAIPGEVRPPETEQESSIPEKIQGFGEAGLSALTHGLAAPVASIAEPISALASGKFGTPEGVKAGENTAKSIMDAMYTPKSESGKRQLEALGKTVQGMGLEALPGLGGEMSALGRAAGPAVQAVKGAGSMGAQKALQTVNAAGNAMVPKLSPQVMALAQKARELGIPLRPDMLTDNKFLRMAGEASEKVPLSGAKTVERQEAFNQSLIKAIGGDEKAVKLTPDVFDKAMSRSGEKIGQISSKVPVKMDEGLATALANRIDHVTKFETTNAANIVKNYIEEIRTKVDKGAIPGETFRKINSQIGKQIRSTSDGDLKNALGELQEDLHDALQRNLSGEDLTALQAARKQYAIAKMLEPLVAKTKTGDISPAGLMARATSDSAKKTAMARGKGGDIGDIARIGQQFLKEPESSGTAERSALYGALGSGAVLAPTKALPIYGAANLYNRLGPKLSDYILKKNQGTP